MVMEKQRNIRDISLSRPPDEPEDTERLFKDVSGHLYRPATWRRSLYEVGRGAPSWEVLEKEDGFVVRVDLPGMEREDVDVLVRGNVLILNGARSACTEVGEEARFCDRVYSNFHQALTLPIGEDANMIGATYSDGVLEVTLPKAVPGEPHIVKVTSAAGGERGNWRCDNVSTDVGSSGRI